MRLTVACRCCLRVSVAQCNSAQLLGQSFNCVFDLRGQNLPPLGSCCSGRLDLPRNIRALMRRHDMRCQVERLCNAVLLVKLAKRTRSSTPYMLNNMFRCLAKACSQFAKLLYVFHATVSCCYQRSCNRRFHKPELFCPSHYCILWHVSAASPQ